MECIGAQNDAVGEQAFGGARQGPVLCSPDVKTSYVYIMASRSRTLYTGVTNDLERRVAEHKRHLTPGFTSRYRFERLVYFETWRRIRDAIHREKQIKAWRRSKKIALIESMNVTWSDLSEDWYGKPDSSAKSRPQNDVDGGRG
jgi:putative endonuclease